MESMGPSIERSIGPGMARFKPLTSHNHFHHCKLPCENFLPVLGIMSLMHILWNSIDADMKLEISGTRWGF